MKQTNRQKVNKLEDGENSVQETAICSTELNFRKLYKQIKALTKKKTPVFLYYC